MQFEVENVDSIKRKITVKVTPEEMGQVEKKVLRKYQKSASIPGFRKGRAPAGILKRSYGESIKADVLESAISDYYEKLLKEIDFRPISQGEIVHIDFENVESGLEFHVQLEAEPAIELKKYKGLKVEKETVLVTDDMVDEALTEIQKNFATVKSVDKSAEGHFITFNAQQLGEGDVPVIGRKFDDINVQIGSGDFDADLEKQLVDLEVNQERIIRKTPDLSASGKGKSFTPENYKITVTAIEERELPPLDDELAKNLQEENIETLDQLKDVLRKNIQINLQRRSLQQFNNRLVDELLKENPFDVPESMAKHYLNHVVEDFKARYPKEKLDESLIRERYRPEAIHTIRWILLKQEIQKAENLEVSDQEILQQIDESNYSDEEKKQMKKNDNIKSTIKDNLLELKVLKLLEANADITEVFPKTSKEGKVVTV